MSDDKINDDAEYNTPPPHKTTKPTHRVTKPKHKKAEFDVERHKASRLIERDTRYGALAGGAP